MNEPKILPKEAIFGFVAWLTCRPKPVIFGVSYDAADPFELAEEYCKYLNLEEIRDCPYPYNIAGPPHAPWPVFPKEIEYPRQMTLGESQMRDSLREQDIKKAQGVFPNDTDR